MRNRIETLPKIIPPAFEFPKNPTIFRYKGYDVYKYIDENRMTSFIENISSQINFSWFDAILVNQTGGDYFFKRLLDLQKRKGNVTNKIVNIEYHRDHSIKIPVPAELKGKRTFCIDDVLDSGGTSKDIYHDSPYTTFLYLTEKFGINYRWTPPRYYSAVRVSNVWIGGCGMNLDSEGDGLPLDFGRDYEGIMAKIL